MNEVGYAVIRDGVKLCGIVPVTFDVAKETRARYAKANPSSRFEVVPVFIGAPVPVVGVG